MPDWSQVNTSEVTKNFTPGSPERKTGFPYAHGIFALGLIATFGWEFARQVALGPAPVISSLEFASGAAALVSGFKIVRDNLRK